jgi:long-chain acyl-CoA synthetase
MLGHCGPPVESVMVKLIDIPEMNYYAKDGKGEVYTSLVIEI